MGAGHSGSTVLSIVLGNHPQIENVGELHKLPRSGWTRDDNRRCACGMPIHNCPYWTAVYQCWTAKVGREGLGVYIGLQNTFERSRLLWPRLLYESGRRSSLFAQYAQMTAALYEAICDVGGKQVVVDSSKAPIRNYALLANDTIDLRIIHLVRDGRSLVWSKQKPLKKNVESGVPRDSMAVASWRTSLDWMITNLESEWVVGRTKPGKALRVTYEQFVHNPGAVLKDIEALASEDLTQVSSALAKGEQMHPGHMVGGNRLRMEGGLVLRPNMEWAHRLPPADRRVFWQMAGWLAKRYGYSSEASNEA